MSDRVKARERRAGVQPDGARPKVARSPQPDGHDLGEVLWRILSESMAHSAELRAMHGRIQNVEQRPHLCDLGFWERLRWLLTGYTA